MQRHNTKQCNKQQWIRIFDYLREQNTTKWFTNHNGINVHWTTQLSMETDSP